MPQTAIKLNPRYLKFVTARMAHPTLEAACKELGISHETGRRYMHIPEVRQAYEDACMDAFNERLTVLRLGVGTALTTLARNMDPSQPSGVQVRAAMGWLAMAVEIHKIATLEAKFTELEQVIGQLMEGGHYGPHRFTA